MKLITLNTWGGRVSALFRDFIRQHKDIDIFCFQEIYERAKDIMDGHYPIDNFDLFSELQELLPEHQGYFRPVVMGVYGVAMFVKKSMAVIEEGEVIIHESQNKAEEINGHHDRNLQWLKTELSGKPLTVVNVHGLWNGKGKTDTPERIAQSEKIRDFLRAIDGPKILCGDFNLEPSTESLKIAGEGMRDLVREYGVTSTRTSLYEKPVRFADYIFVSPDIEVKNFKVLPDEVSDHAALLLEVS